MEAIYKGAHAPKPEGFGAKISAATTGKKISIEHREKISKAKRGQTFSPEVLQRKKEAMNRPEVRAKLSAAGKLLVGEKNPFYGKSHSIETRRQISETKKGTIPVNRKKACVNGVEYPSIKIASKATGISPYFIRKFHLV